MRLFALLMIFLPFLATAQVGEVKIYVADHSDKEPLPDVTVVLGNKLKAKTDIDGYAIFNQVNMGNYEVAIGAYGYDSLFTDIDVKGPLTIKEVLLFSTSIEMAEVKVIGNLVQDRRTPVAVTKLDAKKIAEELGSRDIPMLLNATPGVYATQQGGGDGDARITVRGFDQRNVGVMIDGVPVNDMENGAVYWSNWFGLDNITSGIQVQRGLGATKLAMPSVGGTINILSSGAGNRKSLTLKQEYGTGNFFRTSLSYNSGMNKNGWGYTFSGSYKQGNGWVDGTNTQGAFGYVKIQKKIQNHLISFSAFAAPQQHGQRSYNQLIPYWSTEKADELGMNYVANKGNDRGYRFNEHWGYRTNDDGKKEVFNERLNYYVKPQITLKDFWQVNKKLSISNIAYSSIGRGGGTSIYNYSNASFDENGQLDWDRIIRNNQVKTFFGTTIPNTNPLYSNTLLNSNNIMRSNVNNHFWIGYLGQANYELNSQWSFSAGIDYRYYKGTHYTEIKDLLGGDYFIDFSNANRSSDMLVKGDKIATQPYQNHRDAEMQWAGFYGQAEYTGSRWTAFVNVTAVINGYNATDYFRKKTLDLGDTVLRIGTFDTISYNGQTYNASSSGLKYFETGYKWVPGATIKAGASYKIKDGMSIFANLGYLSRTPMFSNVVDNNTNTFFKEIQNEVIQAIELGWNYASNRFGININGYATNWKNKPFPNGVAVTDPDDPASTIRVNINGMDAIHYGGEIDIAYKINPKLNAEVMMSIGDWRWNSTNTITLPQYGVSYDFDARGVHVGDAPQSTYSFALRYEPIKRGYIRAQYMFFDRYYASFNPFNLQGKNAGRDSWKVPGYGLLNLNAGYSFELKNKDLIILSANVFNVLNTFYISDAIHSSSFGNSFDVNGAGVMFGMGRTFNASIAYRLQ